MLLAVFEAARERVDRFGLIALRFILGTELELHSVIAQLIVAVFRCRLEAINYMRASRESQSLRSTIQASARPCVTNISPRLIHPFAPSRIFESDVTTI